MARLSMIAIVVTCLAILGAPAEVDAATNGPVAFSRFIRGKGTSIRVVNPDGSFASVVARDRDGDLEDAAWAPDGRRIAYGRRLGRARGLWIQNVYRGTRRRLLSGKVATPTWSPDGRRIAFSRERKGGSDLWSVGAAGGRAVQVTRDNRRGVFNLHPDWAPDGSRIVYSRGSSEPPTIRVVRADGSGGSAVIERAESPADFPGSPAWSPDGGRIAFPAADADGLLQVHVISPDGSGRAQLTRSDRNVFDPSWSPLGDQLVVVTSTGSNSNQIWTVHNDGSGARRLPVGGAVSSPDWGSGPILTRRLRLPR